LLRLRQPADPRNDKLYFDNMFKKLQTILAGIFCWLIIFSGLFISGKIFAANFPNPTGFVNDYAKLFSADYSTKLESQLSDFEKQTGNEITIVTVENMGGLDIESYAVKLFEQWKIGKKGSDNGLLLLVAKDEREVRIEVGYGLEPYITDGRAGEIIRNQITPEFKKGDYEAGVEAGINQIKSYIANKDVGPPQVSESFNIAKLLFNSKSIIFLIIIGSYIAGFLGRSKEIWPGGVLGAVLGAVVGVILWSVIGLVIGAVAMGFLGLFFDFILSRNYQDRIKKGLPTNWWSSGGGFRSGGGWGGGGGFGGFGGGSSGGGGASGRW
jgi:uncharacterized protein